MIGKKINQLATELAPVSTDLTIIGDPTTGVSKKITLAQLGAIFSGAVSFYTNLAGFPATGDINVIYCAKDTQKLYLWSGSAYVEVFPSQALLDTYQLRSEKGVSNGYASLDSSGKVPVSQLPSSIMEYKGTWSASTNTPTLANGTGDTGDVYICNSPGSVNFGAGAITFAVGDYVIYSGSIWQRSSGAVGTVTSVGLSTNGNSITIGSSPVTTSGTISANFVGNSTQYINGAGNLVTFPSTIAQAERLITEVYNSTGATLTKGTIVYINGGQGNLPTVTKALATGDSTSAQTFGVVQADITNNNNGYVVVAGKLSDLDTQAYTEGTQLYLSSTTAGAWTSTKQYAPAHLVYVGIVVRSHPTQGIVEVKIMNGFEIDELHNVAAQTPTNNDGLFWESATSLWKNKSISTILGGTPITGSGNVNAIPKFTANSVLGNSVMEDDGNFVSMRGLKLNASAGVGNTINFQQGSGVNAGGLGYSTIGASSTTGFVFYIDQNTTSRNFILDTSTITSDAQRTYSMPATSGTLALVSQLTGGTVTSVGLSSATSGVTIGSSPITTSGTITLAIATASGSQQGLLSSTDWTTFNNKQDALTNPVTGTGTTNYLPKFTGTSTIGNSIVQDDGSTLTIGGALSGRNATFTSSTANIGIIGTGTFSYLQLGHNGGATKYSYLVATNDGMLDIESNIVKFTDYSGASERMRINASGNVSIGNTNDTYKLDVSGSGRFSGTTCLLYLTNTTATTGKNWRFSSASNGNFFITQESVVDALTIAHTTGAATFSSSLTVNGIYNVPSTSYFKGNASFGYRFNNAADTVNLFVLADSGAATFSSNVRAENSITSAGSMGRFGGWYDGNGYTGAAAEIGVSSGTAYVIGYNRSGSAAIPIVFGNAGNTSSMVGSSLSFTGAATFSSSVTAQRGNFYQSASSGAAISMKNRNATQQWDLVVDANAVDDKILGLYDFTNSAYRMVVTPTGNVGIGTTSPASYASNTLQVNGATSASIKITNTTSGVGNTDGLDLLQSTTDSYIWNRTNGMMSFATNNTERMRITSGGNVGIGTTSPIRKLEVYAVDPAFALKSSTTTGYSEFYFADSASDSVGFISYAHSTDNMLFGTSGSERMRIKSNGIINLSNVPSSSAGLSSGDIYKTVAGVLMIV